MTAASPPTALGARARARRGGLTDAQIDYADACATLYGRLTERLGSKAAFHPVEVVEVCGSCGANARTVVGGAWPPGARQREPTEERCARCDAPWTPREVTTLREPGPHSPGASDGYLDAMEKLCVLRPAIERRPPRRSARAWAQHIEAWQLFLDRRVGSMPLIAQMKAATEPDAPLPWTEGHVRGMIERARVVVVQRMRRRARRGEAPRLRALGLLPPRGGPRLP